MKTRWNDIQKLFNDAAELPPEDRRAFLDENCDSDEIRIDVERLLAAEEAAGEFLEAPVLGNDHSRPLATIGRYRIIREVGRGGMGTVFLGERDDLGQRAAIKIIRQGFDSPDILRRFHSERKILATLEHPNIARLIDGGTTDDGLPYYVMEFVEGVPIDEYCRGRSIGEKLELFTQICRAVAFAHARLTVHRDLKPSNIVVNGDGTVKLLDFGIAKLVDPESTATDRGTATSLGLMTPNYASPEQFRGETVTTASDIYSLGVILYELLTGILPYDLRDKPLDRALSIISDTDATRPSRNPEARFRGIDPDLDNIVLKALRKEPLRRYQSAVEFADDIRRFRAGLPITARSDTYRYRAGKFIRRNKIAVVAATLVAASFVVGLIGIYYQYRIAVRERAIAERRFADVRELANKVVFRYHDEIAKFPGAVGLREELVADAVKYLDALNQEDVDDIDLKLELARAYRKIGDVQGQPYAANLGKTDDALESYRKSIAILESVVERSAMNVAAKRELVQSHLRLIPLLARLAGNDWNDEIDRMVALQNEINSADTSDPSRNSLDLSNVLIAKADNGAFNHQQRIDVYLQAFESMKDIPRTSIDVQHTWSKLNQRLGSNYSWLGDELRARGDLSGATKAFESAAEFDERMFQSVNDEIKMAGESQNLKRNLAGSNQNLGEVYIRLGKADEGIRLLKRNLEICTELANADEKNAEARLDVANAWTSLSVAYEKTGDPLNSIYAGRSALAILDKMREADRSNNEVDRASVGISTVLERVFNARGQRDEARSQHSRLAELCSKPVNASVCTDAGFGAGD